MAAWPAARAAAAAAASAPAAAATPVVERRWQRTKLNPLKRGCTCETRARTCVRVYLAHRCSRYVMRRVGGEGGGRARTFELILANQNCTKRKKVVGLRVRGGGEGPGPADSCFWPSPQQAVRAPAELPLCNRSFGTTGFRRVWHTAQWPGRLASMQAECQLSAEAGLSVAPAQQVHQHPSGAVAERRVARVQKAQPAISCRLPQVTVPGNALILERVH